MTAPAVSARSIKETSGPTRLEVGAVADGQFLKRVGSTVVGATGTGGGLGDGDYGDITVSGGGTAMAVDAGVITYAKMQNVSATDKLLGRVSTGAGVVEEVACTAAGRALLDDADAAAQRATLSLGGAAQLNVGTTTGTVAAGDDSRITGAAAFVDVRKRLAFGVF